MKYNLETITAHSNTINTIQSDPSHYFGDILTEKKDFNIDESDTTKLNITYKSTTAEREGGGARYRRKKLTRRKKINKKNKKSKRKSIRKKRTRKLRRKH